MKSQLVTGLLLAIGLNGIAVGQTPSAAAPKPATAAPAQKPIPRSEFIEAMDGEFKERDADKNGVVTKKEIEAFQRALFARVNQERLAALFQRLDADKNGQISPSEFSGLNLPTSPVNAAPLLAQVDLNHDGQVTIVEYRTGKLRSFDDVDADKDGIINVAEMKAGGFIKQ